MHFRSFFRLLQAKLPSAHSQSPVQIALRDLTRMLIMKGDQMAARAAADVAVAAFNQETTTKRMATLFNTLMAAMQTCLQHRRL
jgi:hypothetical protein